MKQNEVKKKIEELMSVLAKNGYSAHFLVAKDRQIECVGASGELEEVLNGFAQMFATAMKHDSPEQLKMVCSAIADIVRQFQQVALDSLLGLDDDEEDCEDCENLHVCANPAAVEKRRQLGLIRKDTDAN